MEQYKVLMIDDDELIARSTADYFNILDVVSIYRDMLKTDPYGLYGLEKPSAD